MGRDAVVLLLVSGSSWGTCGIRGDSDATLAIRFHRCWASLLMILKTLHRETGLLPNLFLSTLAASCSPLIDFFLLECSYTPPVSTWGAVALAIFAGCGYASWVEHTATVNGAFPYPFLTMLPFAGRVCLYAASTVGATLVFRSLNKLHR